MTFFVLWDVDARAFCCGVNRLHFLLPIDFPLRWLASEVSTKIRKTQGHLKGVRPAGHAETPMPRRDSELSNEEIVYAGRRFSKLFGSKSGHTENVMKKFKKVVQAFRNEVDSLTNATKRKSYDKLLTSMSATGKEMTKETESELANSGGSSSSQPKLVMQGTHPSLSTNDAKRKIQRVLDGGPSYGTRGPKSQHKNAKHTHITDKDGFCWVWDGNKCTVLAYGEKSGQAGKDDSGYKWYKR